MAGQTSENYAQVPVDKDLDKKELEQIVTKYCGEQNRVPEAVLRWLADIDLTGDYRWADDDAVALRRILRCDDDLRGKLFQYSPSQYHRPALHYAINKKNLPFLDCLLSLDEKDGYFTRNQLAVIRAEIVAAFQVQDLMAASSTCLHSAIREKLPCVRKMVELCASVQNNDVNLLLNAMDREARRQKHKEVDRSQPPRSIFEIPDAKGNTPLHLLMESLGKPQINARSRRRGALTRTAQTATTEPVEINPMDIIGRIEAGCTPLMMSALWQLVNDVGNSPYKALVDNLKSPTIVASSSTAQSGKDAGAAQQGNSFQDKIKAKIFSSISEIPQLKRASYGTRGQEKELSLDLSDFNRSSHDFKRFVTELVNSTERNAVQFEECLVSVFLPDLNTFKKPVPHDGVSELFEWLRDSGKVRRIKSLNIPDNTTVLMSDGHVSECILERFEIERFVWRKLDINLDILISSPHKSVFTEITLYSTGNFSVLYHWASKDGIGSLPGLRSVTIEIMALNTKNQSQKAQERHRQTVDVYRRRLEEMLMERKREKEEEQGRAGDTKFNFSYKVNTDGKWDFPTPLYVTHQPDEIEQLELIQKLQACHHFLMNMKDKKGDPRHIRNFDKLREWDMKEGEDNSHLIKVAIIDNGAKFRQRIRDCIERGISYVKADTGSADRILPWWMVSDPHGTQMTSLVSAVNPWCRLYIARVGKGRRDILPEDAVQAVKWAMEQKVDIISISWVTKSMEPELRDVIQEAAKNTLIFCSTADRGTGSGPAYPADYNGTVRISATDKYGSLMPASENGSHAVNIPVPGEDIPAFGPSYMGDGIEVGTVSGSSVATALAAGIASLSLLMLMVFNDEDKDALRKMDLYTNKKMGSLLSAAINPSPQSDPLFPVAAKVKELPDRWNLATIMARPEMKNT